MFPCEQCAPADASQLHVSRSMLIKSFPCFESFYTTTPRVNPNSATLPAVVHFASLSTSLSISQPGHLSLACHSSMVVGSSR